MDLVQNKIEGLDTHLKNLFSIAAIFEGPFSIDWFQELSNEKTSQILNALETGNLNNWIDKLAPDVFCLSDPERRLDLLRGLSATEKNDYYRRAVQIVLREQPIDSEKSLTAINLLMKVKNNLAGCQFLCERGSYFHKQYRYKDALLCLKKAIQDLENLSGETAEQLRLEATIQYSKVSTATDDTDHVISTIKKSIQVAEEGNYRAHWVLLKMNLAKHEWLRSDFEVAFQLFEEGWAIYQELDEPELHRAVLVLSTFFHHWLGHYRQAIKNYESMAPEIEHLPNSEFPILTRTVISNAYCYVGQVSYGLSILESLREHCLKRGDVGLAGNIHVSIADVYLRVEKFESAEQHMEKALSECTKHNNNYGILASRLGLAYILHRLDRNREAVGHLEKFLDLSRTTQMGFRFVATVLKICLAMYRGRFPEVGGLSLEKEIADAQKSKNVYMCGMGYFYRGLKRRIDQEPLAGIIRDFNTAAKWLEESGNEISLAKVRVELARLYHESGRTEQARPIVAKAAKILLSVNADLIPNGLKALLDETPGSEQFLDEILKLGQEIINIRDNRELAVRIISTSISVTGAERGALFLFDEIKGELELRAAKNLTEEEVKDPGFSHIRQFIEKSFQSGNGKVVDFEEGMTDSSRSIGKSCICVPLILRKKVIGVLYNDNYRFKRSFREKDFKILDYFAAQAAMALDNTQAYATLQEMYQKQKEEKKYFEEQYLENKNFEDIVGKSRPIGKVFSQIASVAKTDTTVLILGETGVGKELVARAIHRNSDRRNGPFVRVNCSTFSEQLISSELFGHEKGAFTGAIKQQVGRFELANEGTIFLDEIGDIPMSVQVQLLRVLQGKEFERVGGQKTLYSNFRLMAATNRDLKKGIAAGRFRKDLYYRLSVFPIDVPPLRNRVEDIPLLAYHFLRLYAKKFNKNVKKIPHAEMKKLLNYDWPGNIRELENIIERGLIISDGPYFLVPKTSLTESTAEFKRMDLSLEENEKTHILKVLKMTGGKVRGHDGAAEILRIHPNTLYSRMKKLGIRDAVRTRTPVADSLEFDLPGSFYPEHSSTV